MSFSNEDFNRVLLVIRSVKGESWWQRRKVFKKVKEWRSNNSYQVIDYSREKAEYLAQTYENFEVGKYYKINRNYVFFKEKNTYGRYELNVKKPLVFFYGENGAEFLDDRVMDEWALSAISDPATSDQITKYHEKKSKLKAVQKDIDNHRSMMNQNIEVKAKILAS